MAECIGFIGLGTMGLPMAKNIASKGYSLYVYDSSKERMELFKNFSNITLAGSMSDIGSACDIVITMLPTPQIISDAVHGVNGLFAYMKPGSIWIDMSTSDPAMTRSLAEESLKKGIFSVDAPVGRSSSEAERGELIVLAGCDEKIFTRVKPLLSTMATDILYCGSNGTGHTMKLVNNHLNLTILQVSLEALVLGRKSGLTVDTMMKVLRHTAAWNGHLEGTIPNKVFRRDFEPGFKLSLAAKDFDLVKLMARSANVPILFGSLTRELMAMGIAEGNGDKDHSVMATFLERMAGITIQYEDSKVGDK